MRRSKFNLSHYKLLSCDMGELIPIGLTEVLPGDTVQHNTTALIRLSPLLSPVMHPVDARIHHWFVPHRLVWDEWEDFITGGPDGMDNSDFPTIGMPAVTGAPVGSLADYLGVPTGPSMAALEVSALPFRGYQLIWNEWYRDQDLQTPVPISTDSGNDAVTSTALQNVNWEKDYFTSARPWEQKGPAITIPLGTSAPVRGVGGIGATAPTFSGPGGNNPAPLTLQFTSGTNNTAWNNSVGTNSTARWAATGLETDLSAASAVTVNLLREALALQRFEEARARYGSRYVEYLRYLGVRSADARLQRPEYLGGGSQKIQFSEVLQTAEGTNPVGELRGHGIGAMRSNRYRRFIEEHGYIHSFLSVKPKTVYAQGLFRHWNRRTKEDYWQKELEHIGQQEVLNKEVYAAHPNRDGVFGFTNRYDEYRRTESSVAGEFRTSQLDFWHFARIFDAPPALNNTFVRSVPPERPFAVPSEDVLYVMARHQMAARRLVSASSASYIF